MNRIEENILYKLEKELNPKLIEIKDESHLHANHNPSAKKGGTHFKIKIVSEKFKGKSRIEKHRIVNDILENEFKKGLHALTLSLSDVE
tara:strand:- start:395 stop:661 length:267 start_codon:yes stop_codon:yes gene_type:complete